MSNNVKSVQDKIRSQPTKFRPVSTSCRPFTSLSILFIEHVIIYRPVKFAQHVITILRVISNTLLQCPSGVYSSDWHCPCIGDILECSPHWAGELRVILHFYFLRASHSRFLPVNSTIHQLCSVPSESLTLFWLSEDINPHVLGSFVFDLDLSSVNLILDVRVFHLDVLGSLATRESSIYLQ